MLSLFMKRHLELQDTMQHKNCGGHHFWLGQLSHLSYMWKLLKSKLICKRTLLSEMLCFLHSIFGCILCEFRLFCVYLTNCVLYFSSPSPWPRPLPVLPPVSRMPEYNNIAGPETMSTPTQQIKITEVETTKYIHVRQNGTSVRVFRETSV